MIRLLSVVTLPKIIVLVAVFVCFEDYLVLTKEVLSIQKIEWRNFSAMNGDIELASNWNRPLGRGKFLEAGIVVDEKFDYKSELLMLARAIYSETKNLEEQRLLAWVVRNRVETGFRGEHSYRAVVLDPEQFSTFNNSKVREGFLALDFETFETEGEVWQKTLDVAREVIRAPRERNPLPEEARHFFSPRSMCEGKCTDQKPIWAKGRKPLKVPGLNPWRFQIFNRVT